MKDLLIKWILLGLAVVAILGCNRSQSDQLQMDQSLAADLASDLASADLETEEDVLAVVSHAAECDRAVLFIHLEWAFTALYCKQFVEFMLEWQEKRPNLPVLFHYVDCTPIDSGYGPLKNLPGWRELEERAGTSLIHGWGEVVWLESGEVLHVEPIVNFQSVNELVEKTEALMSLL